MSLISALTPCWILTVMDGVALGNAGLDLIRLLRGSLRRSQSLAGEGSKVCFSWALWVNAGRTDSERDLDSDSDGLHDVNQTKIGTFVLTTDAGTDPQKPDTRGDGLGDGEVVGAGFDPIRNNAPLFSLVKTKSIADQPRTGLFTEGAMMDLNLGGVVLRKSGSIVNLRLPIQDGSPHCRMERRRH